MANPQNYYEILKVPQDATLQEIKIAFRRLARQYHPDLHPNQPTATEQFKKICQAYEILSDSELRQEYDLKINTPVENYQTEPEKVYDQELENTLEYYNRVIARNPNYWPSYLKRAEVYYQLYKDSSVLEDCQTILRINPNSDQAYYYLGLARQRLGYTQSAIDAYTKAIQLSNQPQFYQHRGLAYEELENYSQSINDFRIAVNLYQKNQEFHYVSTLQRKIDSLLKQKEKTEKQWIKNIFEHTLGILYKFISASWLIIKHPLDGLLLAFMSLSKTQALMIGIIYGLMGLVIWNAIVILPTLNKIVLGLCSFVLLPVLSNLGRILSRSYGHLASDVFLGGFTSLLISIIFYLNLNPTQLPEAVLLTLTVILVLYLGYNLKNGYTQITNLPRPIAVFLTFSILSFMIYFLIVWL
ncbi:J domain-containing protein [Chroococcus sp. FPU101]|uniref:J domain-containing protein n=1 Tax=Chroococcus sp. FPU101 TaxID=1974212 RepID=UPI001A900A69|nr:J domain-containing protein [Chroococcus sp. FPU101]GFE68746.1 heat shock protein 40 [Chroococcus sp. FPU101]